MELDLASFVLGSLFLLGIQVLTSAVNVIEAGLIQARNSLDDSVDGE